MSQSKRERLNQMEKVLLSKEKSVTQTEHSPNGILARMWRTVLYDLKIGIDDWGNKLTDHIEHAQNASLRNEKISVRGTLNKELASPSITFNTFLRGFRILSALRLKITIEPMWANGKRTQHSFDIALATEEEIEEALKRHAERYSTKKTVDPNGFIKRTIDDDSCYLTESKYEELNNKKDASK